MLNSKNSIIKYNRGRTRFTCAPGPTIYTYCQLGLKSLPIKVKLSNSNYRFYTPSVVSRLHTAPSTSFYLYRGHRGLHLKINTDTLKTKDVIHLSQKKMHRHFDFFYLIINQCFLEESGLPSESPSTYNYPLVAGQSSDIANLPPLHVKRCPKQALREIVPVSRGLIFVHRSRYYSLSAAVSRYEIIPGAGLTVFVQDRGYPAFPLRHSAQLKVNRGLPPSLEFEVHPRTLGLIYPTPLPPRLGQKNTSNLKTAPI